jgi:hypothetical protein
LPGRGRKAVRHLKGERLPRRFIPVLHERRSNLRKQGFGGESTYRHRQRSQANRCPDKGLPLIHLNIIGFFYMSAHRTVGGR